LYDCFFTSAPQLKRDPLGCAHSSGELNDSSQTNDGAIAVVAMTALVYSGFGEGPGAAIMAISFFKVGIIIALAVAFPALGFALSEVRATPVRTLPNVVTAAAASLVSLLLLVAAARLWLF